MEEHIHACLPNCARPHPDERVSFADHKDAKGYERFVREIRHELVMLPYYGVFDNLAYGWMGTR